MSKENRDRARCLQLIRRAGFDLRLAEDAARAASISSARLAQIKRLQWALAD